MEISIQKGTSISLHKQLVTQISLQITSGLLKPGVKLPSIRALSQKLGIHHNTCLSAYRELEEIGLIQIRHGSGIRVAMTDQDAGTQHLPQPEPAELNQLADFFVQQTLLRGYQWKDALAALTQARDNLNEHGQHPLIFVDIHADILPIFQAELQQLLNRPIQVATINQMKPSLDPHSHFIVSRYHYQALKDRLVQLAGNEVNEQRIAERITMIDVGAVRQELDLIKQLPAEALVAIISDSTIILQQAEAVIKALRGEDVYIRTVLAGHENGQEVQRILKRAQAIFADWLCVPKLQMLTQKPIHTIRIIPVHEVDKLKAFKEAHSNTP